MFFLADDGEDRQIKEPRMIIHALTKMKDTGLYSKSIDGWNIRSVQDRSRWSDSHTFMIGKYELMANTRPTGGTNHR